MYFRRFVDRISPSFDGDSDSFSALIDLASSSAITDCSDVDSRFGSSLTTTGGCAKHNWSGVKGSIPCSEARLRWIRYDTNRQGVHHEEQGKMTDSSIASIDRHGVKILLLNVDHRAVSHKNG